MSRLPFPSPLLRAALRPYPSCTAGSSSSSSSVLLPRCIAATRNTPSRLFSHLPNLRPTLANSNRTIFRAPSSISPRFTPMPTPTDREGVADVVPPMSISSHPAFCGIASQIRYGPRPTMSGHSRLIQKRRHGFLSRAKTKNGIKTLKRRRAKGRKRLAA